MQVIRVQHLKQHFNQLCGKASSEQRKEKKRLFCSGKRPQV